MQKEVRKMEEQERMGNSVGMKKQKSWERARQEKIFWNDIWLKEPTVSLGLFVTCCPHQPIWQHGA